MRWIAAVWLVGVAACAEPPASFSARGAEIVGIVRDHFFDKYVADAWAEKHAHYASAANSEVSFAELTSRALLDLKASHTGYFTKRHQKYYGLRAIFAGALELKSVKWDSPGVDFAPDGFVRTVFAGGAADKAGLRRGDKILAADGRPFQPVESFRGRSGKPVVLTFQRRADGPTVQTKLVPRSIDPREEWLEAERKGARAIERNGKTVAYVPIFSGAGDEYRTALEELLAEKFRDADALVIDFRNGFGGCNPNFVNIFNRAPPAFTIFDRAGKRQFDSQWRKPVYVLINGGSTSGKEVVAYAIKKHRLGTLIGERTAGAVVAGRCFALSDGSLLYLAVNDLLVDGERLEGKGVEPDVEVADRLPFADGADPQLEKVLELATR